VLTQAVWEVRLVLFIILRQSERLQFEQNHTKAEVDHFISKLRVYSISDQDDCKLHSIHFIVCPTRFVATPWLRRRHPQIFWIVSLHAMNVYV